MAELLHLQAERGMRRERSVSLGEENESALAWDQGSSGRRKASLKFFSSKVEFVRERRPSFFSFFFFFFAAPLTSSFYLLSLSSFCSLPLLLLQPITMSGVAPKIARVGDKWRWVKPDVSVQLREREEVLFFFFAAAAIEHQFSLLLLLPCLRLLCPCSQRVRKDSREGTT